MTGKLCLLCCGNFLPEIEAAVAAEGWGDVSVAAFPARCGHPPTNWDELRPLVPADCTAVAVLGRACLHGLEAPPNDWPPVRRRLQENCFHLVAGATPVAEAIGRGAYLITPGWLRDWRRKVAEMGFDATTAPDFFHGFARSLELLDTGVVPDADRLLVELAATLDLPAGRTAVGIDYTRLLLGRWVAEWRLEEAHREARERDRDHSRAVADLTAAMDVLGQLAQLKDEAETVAAIEDLFRMLFAPQDLFLVRFAEGTAQAIDALPQALAAQLAALKEDWAWTASGSGFLLRIGRSRELLAVVIVDRLAFPEFRERYLNLALSVADVCGLAIENARSFHRLKETEAALRKSEFSLKIAQAIAHLGHWEWDVASGDMRWSDETYRILGYEPHALAPSDDTFFLVIHPDDREMVGEHIRQARQGHSFDLEYRVVLPGGSVRVVHGMGTALRADVAGQPRLIGTIQDLTAHAPLELLGVIQDITDRKELEWRLAREASTDPLTGCANRRRFLELARQEIVRVRRYGGSLSVLALDLDHFKKVNDRHGHHVGDLALQMLVQVCHATLREEDTVGRLGGEEFAILLPQTPAERAVEVAERVRRAVEAARVDLEPDPSVRFTTSVGVASLEAADKDIDALLGRADRALYQAKESGRNRVVSDTPVS